LIFAFLGVKIKKTHPPRPNEYFMESRQGIPLIIDVFTGSLSTTILTSGSDALLK
jgi:hypothetical protein